MSVRLRDVAVALEPATRENTRTGASEVDWTAAPARELATPFQYSQLATDEQQLTDTTIVTRGRGFLPPALDGVITSDWRIRWDGDDYVIDGDIGRYKTRTQVRYLTVLLRLVKGSASG